MSALALHPFWCHVCCLDWPEPYCEFCGASLVPRKQTSGPGLPSQADRDRANQEATEDA